MGARYEIYPEKSWTLFLGLRVSYRWKLVLSDDTDFTSKHSYPSRAQAYFAVSRFSNAAFGAQAYDIDETGKPTPLGFLRKEGYGGGG